MKELTPYTKQQITKDWLSSLTSLGVYEPLHLLRQVGPLLMGVLLERDSSNRSYRPTFHLHNLCREFPVVALTLCDPLHTANGADETIDVKDHARKFKNAAQRLADQSPLAFAGDLKIAHVIEAYHSYQSRGGLYATDPHLYYDMALIYAWAGQKVKAEAIVSDGKATMGKWPKFVLDRMGGLDTWIAKVSTAIEDPEKLSRTVQQQLAALHAQGLPVSQLII